MKAFDEAVKVAYAWDGNSKVVLQDAMDNARRRTDGLFDDIYANKIVMGQIKCTAAMLVSGMIDPLTALASLYAQGVNVGMEMEKAE